MDSFSSECSVWLASRCLRAFTTERSRVRIVAIWGKLDAKGLPEAFSWSRHSLRLLPSLHLECLYKCVNYSQNRFFFYFFFFSWLTYCTLSWALTWYLKWEYIKAAQFMLIIEEAEEDVRTTKKSYILLSTTAHNKFDSCSFSSGHLLLLCSFFHEHQHKMHNCCSFQHSKRQTNVDIDLPRRELTDKKGFLAD